ncbi:MAG: hypothetical protein ABFR63_07495, partial [Thermodesulfobacteriota bacterium]
MLQTLIAILILLPLLSCSPDQEKESSPEATPPPSVTSGPEQTGCLACHPVTLDPAHDFECSSCHQGSMETNDKELAHTGLIKQPAHPDHMQRSCGKCHGEQVKDVSHSLHFTLRNEVNLVRSAFGAEEEVGSLTEIPTTAFPDTPLELADDLLRRRCLRCHPYYSGDRYPAIVRGTGCASCHLHRYEGKLVSHSFLKTPGDSQCLQCHYGNRVGFDYYGRYEHDMNDEYRTPYTTRQDYFRPFGMEYHQLSSDIHQQRGLICVDCHRGEELMGGSNGRISCADCHDRKKISRKLSAFSLKKTGEDYSLHSAGDNREHAVPLMTHPAHREYENEEIACQVCHGQWSFNDAQTSLLRSDVEEYDDFARLSVQGSFEVEKIIKNNLDFDAEELPHTMSD